MDPRVQAHIGKVIGHRLKRVFPCGREEIASRREVNDDRTPIGDPVDKALIAVAFEAENCLH